MKNKEEFKKLVDDVKNKAKAKGEKLRNEEIAIRLGISRTYLSDLLGIPGKDVTLKHIEDFKAHFREELIGIVKPSQPGDIVNKERALIKMLYQRLAKLESERLGIPIDKVMDEMDRDTMIAWRDLEKEEGEK